MKAIDLSEKLPKYRQINSWLKEMIRKGRYQQGQQLPSEHKLAEICGVNRNTVRQALLELESEGLITRKIGMGTFVRTGVYQPVRYSLDNITSFTEYMKSLGYKPHTRLISKRIIEASNDVSEKLVISPGEKIIEIVRIRGANGIPFILEKSHLPYREFKEVSNMKLDGSLYQILTKFFGIRLHSAYQILKAIALPSAVANLLRVPHRAPGIFLEYIVYDDNNIAIEVHHSYCRGDKCSFQVHSGRYRFDFDQFPKENS